MKGSRMDIERNRLIIMSPSVTFSEQAIHHRHNRLLLSLPLLDDILLSLSFIAYEMSDDGWLSFSHISFAFLLVKN